MNESVYALIPPKAAPKVAGEMYRSKHRNLAPTCSTFGLQGTSKVLGNVAGNPDDIPVVHPAVKPIGTFGKSVSQTINPQNFLKKNDGVCVPTQTFKRAAPAEVKPPVPTRAERPVMGLTTDKDFVVANAVESILTAPKRTTVAAARPTESQNFGQVPGYLTRIKTELKASQGKADAAKQAAAERDALETLSPDETDELRAALKLRHEALSKQFQTLSFTLETATQKKRKETLEREMSDIESSLKKLSKRRIIVVDE